MREHRGAFEYDWRTRFGVALSVVGSSMMWGEAWRLTQQLAGDPSSRVAASIGGLDYPIDRTSIVLMDLYDLQHRIVSKRPKPYPRPWSSRRRARPNEGVSREVILAALREAGHTAPLPT